MAFDLVARLKLVDNMTGQLNRINNHFAKLTAVTGAAAVAVGAVATVGSSVKKAMDFESQLSSIKALTGSTDVQMKQVQALALEMGAKTKYSALESAQGIEELLKAGMSLDTVKTGGLESALNLATAGGLGLADAAEIMSDALNAFKRDGISASQAANILAGTANASSTSVHELKYSLAAVGAVASGVGMTFRDTNIALGLFANNGVKGSDAGTSLKTMLSNLQPKTKDQIALFTQLGLVTKSGANQFFTARGKLKSLDQIAGLLQNSLKGLTDQQRSLALETMFGSDAVRAGNILFKEGAAGVKKFSEEMSKVTAVQVAKEKMNNAAGAVEQLKGAFETLQITLGMAFLPTIKDVANGLADLISNNMPQIEAFSNRMKVGLKDIFAPFFDKQFANLSFGDKLALAAERGIEKMAAWINGPGAEVLQSTVTTLAAVGTEVGVAVGTALVKGIGQALVSHPIAAAVTALVMAAKTPGVNAATSVGIAIAAALTAQIVSGVNKAMDYVAKQNELQGNLMRTDYARGMTQVLEHKGKPGPVFQSGNMTTYNPSKWEQAKNWITSKLPGHATGLDRVPYDNYAARLHKGEAVLTAAEADKWRKYGIAGEYSPAVTSHTTVSTSEVKTIGGRALAPQVTIESGAFTVNVSGSHDPRKLADELLDHIAEGLTRKVIAAGMAGA